MSAGFKLPLHALSLRCRWRAVLLPEKANSNNIVVIVVVVVLLPQKVNSNNIVVLVVVVVLLPQKVNNKNIVDIIVVDLITRKANIRIAHLRITPEGFHFSSPHSSFLLYYQDHHHQL